MKGVVISCFDFTTQFVQPWAAAGFICYCVDLQHPPGETWDGNICRVGADVRSWQPPAGPVAFAAFWPPCTDLAYSGAHRFKSKGLRKLSAAIELFAVSVELAERWGCPYLIENPRSSIKLYWREADFKFNPCDYAGYLPEPIAEAYTKETHIWQGQGFTVPERRPVVPTVIDFVSKVPGGPNQANIRSKTPLGFAHAVFQANARC